MSALVLLVRSAREARKRGRGGREGEAACPRLFALKIAMSSQ